jgi:hypothetical protein
MALQAVGSSLVSPASDNIHQNLSQKRDLSAGLPQKNSTVEARLVSEYYSSKSLSFEYTSKDGDTVSLSMESVEYSKSILEVAASGDENDMKKLIQYIKDIYDQMKKELLGGFLNSIGADVPEDQKVKDTAKTNTLQIPEEWNAENTSQRIADFAVSFFTIFKGKDDEFLSTIKAAVEEGFKQAREFLGELPDEVSGLIDDTYSLTMKKLDAWAEKQGIIVPGPAEEVVA